MDKLIFCILSMIVLMSCSTDGNEDSDLLYDYFIFGDYYGFCAGDCTTAYKLEDGALYADIEETFQIDPQNSFMDTPLSDEAYDMALDLVLDFPEELWNDDTEVFGIPDAYDQGGIFVSYNRNGTVKSWTIDTQIQAITDAPDYVKAYTTQIKNVLNTLR